MQSFRDGNGTPLQYSCLENPRDGEAWWAAIYGVTQSWTRLSDFPFTFQFCALEKEMATHSSVLAWRIPGTGEPGVLPSMGSYRVGHDWSDLAAAAAAEYWKSNVATTDVILISITLGHMSIFLFFNFSILTCKDHQRQIVLLLLLFFYKSVKIISGLFLSLWS